MAARSPYLTVHSAQGSRTHHEDRWVVQPVAGGDLLAVFDGHRGVETAELAQDQIVPFFEKAMSSNEASISDALQATFSDLVKLTHVHVSGSTAVAAYIPGDKSTVFCAVLGDSLIIVRDAQGKIVISPDHNIRSNVEEREAAERRGATFIGGYLEDRNNPGIGLQMSRALGDEELDRVLNRQPDVYSVPLGEKSFVLLGSDGLLKPFDDPIPDQIVHLTNLVERGADAQSIVEDALRRETRDNVTTIVWRR